MKKFNKGLILTICFALLFSLGFVNQPQAETNIDDSYSIIVDNDKKLTIKGEIEGVKGFLTLDKEKNEISLKTTGESKEFGNEDKEYQLQIETATQDHIEATFIDNESGEEYYINNNEVQASLAFLIPIGIVIGEVLLAHLISIGLALVISGVTYIAYEEFIKRDRTKSHYMATRQSEGLFIGNGLSASAATARLQTGGDTWSNSSYGAQGIAKEASYYKKTIGAEIDKYGSGKHYHYHPVVGFDRYGVSIRGAHAFYGAPRL